MGHTEVRAPRRAVPPSPEFLEAPFRRGKVPYTLYRGVGRHATSDAIIVLVHGWLGGETMHFNAAVLASQGYDVANFTQHEGGLFSPNKHRSAALHVVTRDALEQTGKNQVVYIVHSNGQQDAIHNAEHAAQVRRETGETPYAIRAIGGVAGLGLNGRHVSPIDFVEEIYPHLGILQHHAREDLRVLGSSLRTIVEHPFRSLAEGVSAMHYDGREAVSKLVSEGTVGTVDQTYMTRDRIIRLPDDRSNVTEVDGSHLTAVIEPDAFIATAERLAA